MVWRHRPCRSLMLQIVVDMLTSPSWLQSILLVEGKTDRPNGVLFITFVTSYFRPEFFSLSSNAFESKYKSRLMNSNLTSF
jgi:hypothetical protein